MPYARRRTPFTATTRAGFAKALKIVDDYILKARKIEGQYYIVIQWGFHIRHVALHDATFSYNALRDSYLFMPHGA